MNSAQKTIQYLNEAHGTERAFSGTPASRHASTRMEPNGYGLVDKFVGRAKEAAGSVLDDEELIREGRLQGAGAGARSGKVIELRTILARFKQLDAKAERKEADRHDG